MKKTLKIMLILAIIIAVIISVILFYQKSKYIYTEYCGDNVYAFQKYVDGGIEFYKNKEQITVCRGDGNFETLSQQCKDLYDQCDVYRESQPK